MKFETGDFVILKKRAVKEFYGSGDRPLDFVKGYPTWENFTSESFVDFIGTYLGFESGDMVGIVSGRGIDDNTIKVNHIDAVTDKIEFSYYCNKDLKKVKVRITD
jgi:hypothetical protein